VGGVLPSTSLRYTETGCCARKVDTLPTVTSVPFVSL
jgi:hypothetical protein